MAEKPEKAVDPVTGNPPVNYLKTLIADVLLYAGVLFQFIALEPDTFLSLIPHPPKWIGSTVLLIGVLWKIGAKAQAAAKQTQAKKGA